MQQAESLSLDEIEGFLDGCESVTFTAGNRAQKYALVAAVLKRALLSRARLTRLIGQFLRERCVRPSAYRRRRFPTKYTRADIVLLAPVDRVHQRLCGPATHRILEREFQICGRKQFARPAELSVAHLYNLRKRPVYQRHGLHLEKTHPTPAAVDEVTQWQGRRLCRTHQRNLSDSLTGRAFPVCLET